MGDSLLVFYLQDALCAQTSTPRGHIELNIRLKEALATRVIVRACNVKFSFSVDRQVRLLTRVHLSSQLRSRSSGPVSAGYPDLGDRRPSGTACGASEVPTAS